MSSKQHYGCPRCLHEVIPDPKNEGKFLCFPCKLRFKKEQIVPIANLSEIIKDKREEHKPLEVEDVRYEFVLKNPNDLNIRYEKDGVHVSVLGTTMFELKRAE